MKLTSGNHQLQQLWQVLKRSLISERKPQLAFIGLEHVGKHIDKLRSDLLTEKQVSKVLKIISAPNYFSGRKKRWDFPVRKPLAEMLPFVLQGDDLAQIHQGASQTRLVVLYNIY